MVNTRRKNIILTSITIGTKSFSTSLKKSIFNKNKNKEYRYIEKPATDLSEINYKKTEGLYRGIRGNTSPISEKEKTVKLEFSIKKTLSKEELKI